MEEQKHHPTPPPYHGAPPTQPANPYPQPPEPPQTIYIREQPSRTNGMGIAGFVCALLAILLFFIPGLNWLLWLLSLIFSIIGVCKAPRGLAIAGLILSFIGVIISILFMGFVFLGITAGAL